MNFSVLEGSQALPTGSSDKGVLKVRSEWWEVAVWEQASEIFSYWINDELHDLET
jgi:hypothetical protein